VPSVCSVTSTTDRGRGLRSTLARTGAIIRPWDASGGSLADCTWISVDRRVPSVRSPLPELRSAGATGVRRGRTPCPPGSSGGCAAEPGPRAGADAVSPADGIHRTRPGSRPRTAQREIGLCDRSVSAAIRRTIRGSDA
jgi:hypothetical protein